MSATFKDATGREWKLRLNTGLVADVKAETGINLGLVSKDASWVNLLFGDEGRDDGRFVSVLWVLCERQAKEQGVTPKDFGYLFDGQTLEGAGVALANAIADFFPRSAIAVAIRKGLPKILATADAKAVASIETAISTACSSATNSPESVESNPVG